MKVAFAFAAILPAFSRAEYNPQEVQWAPCGTNMYCGKLEFCGTPGNLFNLFLPNFGYRLPGDNTECGSKNGPQLRMKPGYKYKLTLQSDAPYDVATNMHTHGLHVNGDGDGDNVVRQVKGGGCLDYVYDIPADHPGGTYWYHPHFWGSMLQLTGGAYGMIVIEDDSTGSSLGSWATEDDNEKLLQIYESELPMCSPEGNGRTNEVIKMEANRYYRLRVSLVTSTARSKQLEFLGNSCTIKHVASDGVWHTASFDTYTGNSYMLTGAGRADFAIKCSAGTTTIKWGGKTAAVITSGNYNTNDGMTGTSDLGTAPPPPASLTGIASASVPPSNMLTITSTMTAINGKSWNPHVGLGDINYDEVYEWTLKNTEEHPFHLHLYHMMIVTPGGCGAHKEGEFYDTISAPADCKVRFKTADFGQRMVMHCHTFMHGDHGSMTWMNVVNVPPSQMNTNYSPDYYCGA